MTSDGRADSPERVRSSEESEGKWRSALAAGPEGRDGRPGRGSDQDGGISRNQFGCYLTTTCSERIAMAIRPSTLGGIGGALRGRLGLRAGLKQPLLAPPAAPSPAPKTYTHLQ